VDGFIAGNEQEAEQLGRALKSGSVRNVRRERNSRRGRLGEGLRDMGRRLYLIARI